MSDELSFNMFGEGGFINPTRWSYAETDPSRRGSRWGLMFYDSASGRMLQKQASDFDGGWRWFEEYEAHALCIYNIKLDRRAYFHLTRIDMVDSVLTPELLLYWAKSMVIVDHNFYTAKNWLEDHIRAMARRAMIEIKKEIRGDDSPHLHSVRK